jgi:D-galactarolactone cycloisomerase
MSRIRDIRLIPLEYRLGVGEGYGSARGITNSRGGGLVILETEDGVHGIGEAWGPAAVSRAYLEMVKPLYVGRSVFAQRGAAQTVLAQMYHFGTQNQLTALLGGIDIAAHDAMGKLLNLSVADLIGGRQRERVPVYASGGYFTETGDQSTALARQLEPIATRGFTAFKIKIGRNPSDDAARAQLARRIIGETPLLMVDTNGNYTEDSVLESMRRTAPFNIHWYEEPLAPQDWAGYASLRSRAPVPLATGEALYGVFDFRRLIDARLASVVQPDLTLCGGFDVARTIGTLCAAEHLRISPHVWGTGIGLAAAVHFVASLPNYPHGAHVPYPPLVEYDVGRNGLQNGIFVEPIRYADGHLNVPKGPGLGVTLDEAAVRQFIPA